MVHGYESRLPGRGITTCLIVLGKKSSRKHGQTIVCLRGADITRHNTIMRYSTGSKHTYLTVTVAVLNGLHVDMRMRMRTLVRITL